MATVLNKALYARVKKEADAKFAAPTSAYKSGYIVRTYKARGGEYAEGSKTKAGLTKWFQEDWVDLTRPVYNRTGKLIGYEACGRKSARTTPGKYPYCRPLAVAEKMTATQIKKACANKQIKMRTTT